MARVSKQSTHGATAPSRGRFVGTGNGPAFQPIDIGHEDYVAVLEPDTAFWALVKREDLAEVALGGELAKAYRKKSGQFAEEMQTLRFGLKPSAVYFNPTERCNLNCTYCYIPETMRRKGQHMSREKLLDALAILKKYFRTTVPKGSLPQIIFHGAEPMLNREAVFAGIERYADDFRFGVQTNATLLDDSAIAFLRDHDVSVGISLDAPTAAIADRTRNNWEGQGVYAQVIDAMKRLKGYPGWSVICTMSNENLRHLTKLVDFLHGHEVPTCLMNILRCTLPRSRSVKPDDASAAKYFLQALERTHELYEKTGRKLIVGNFANILLAIVAPAARRLMCDISPCGGGRCFFALAPSGDLFPCSEFIGLENFRGGNLFTDDIAAVMESKPFKLVSERKVEDIDPCNRCAIRHFCGSPCPAEAHEMNGGMHKTGAFCEFYEEQVRYAFRLIADEKVEDFLWDGWDKDMRQSFSMS
jgi:uncharacterized protein